MTNNQIVALGKKYINLKGNNQGLWKKIAEEVELNGFGKYAPSLYSQMFRGTQVPSTLRNHHLDAIKVVQRYVSQGYK